MQNRQRRVWLLVAAIAIGVALVFLLILPTHSQGAAAWLAILPVFFVGAISPLSLLSPMAYMYLGRTPEAPVLPISFQRPPPLRFA